MHLDFTNTNILVVGDIILDKYIYGNVSRVSPEAPVPVIHFDNEKYVLGGAANVAANLKGLGCNVSIFGILGNDKEADLLKELLKKEGINAHIHIDGEIPTITKTRVLGNNHQICRIDVEKIPENDTLSLNVIDIIGSDIDNYDVLLISDYNKGLINHDTTPQLINYFKNNNRHVIIDPKKDNWNLYSNASIITPNSKEFHILTKMDIHNQYIEDIIPHARVLIDKYYLEGLLITRSEKGILWVSNDNYINMEAVAKDVFDVSGAGDTVISIVAAGMACGFDMNKNIYLANIAAGIVVGKVGTHPINIIELQNTLNNK